uniref:F-box domain-containing protein n=1 Tax=Oryza punctata TaxID=4537 RepID=A0A0E0LLY6_ORYPU
MAPVVLVPIDDGSDGEGAPRSSPPPPPPPLPWTSTATDDGRDCGGEGDSAAASVPPEGSSAALFLTLGLHVHGDGGGVDGLSDLPDDILAKILDHVRDTCNYDEPLDSRIVQEALAAHARKGTTATDIRLLEVTSLNSTTANVTASWLRVAAPRVIGELFFRNRSSVPFNVLNEEMVVVEQLVEELGVVMKEMGAFELPCFMRVTKITLSLGFLGLSLPPSGVFAELRELHLVYVQFNGELTMDDAMLPSLEWLDIRHSSGLASLTLRLAPRP